LNLFDSYIKEDSLIKLHSRFPRYHQDPAIRYLKIPIYYDQTSKQDPQQWMVIVTNSFLSP